MAAESPEGEPGDRNRRCFLEHNNDLVINRIDREAYDEEVHSGPYRGSPYSLISLWRAAAGPADYRSCGNRRGAPCSGNLEHADALSGSSGRDL